ncbi:hypothetical protein ILUMI_22055 [Ignelater luminosus]|uniref:propanoyl-CoA C-acyltransferase n=1 Tax=Ignelater luminosus TaxID=2038154 RepID=A0A8K0CF28_IGNLU|nr:hypothetical protein ILUMI_22055 [Ignelater luminosus]
MGKVYIVGLGMTKFSKPRNPETPDYPELAKEAILKALDDCKVAVAEIQQAYVGYVYGDSTCGQRAVYEVAMLGIPIFNVNNNCATGATALYLAKEAVESGKSDCILALGFEKMDPGSLTHKFQDRTYPLDKHLKILQENSGVHKAATSIQLFNAAGLEHMQKYGTRIEHFAKIAQKNHKHSVNNPYSQFQDEYSLQEVLNSKNIFGMLTKLQCCPTSDGAAAVIVASEKFVEQHNLKDKAVEIVGMEMATDLPSTFSEKSCIKLVGYDMTKLAANRLFEKANRKRSDVQVIELHDCFSVNELLTYEALGLCEPGKAGELIERGDNTYGGKYVVNPSGGLISKGHPLGATGIAQCIELCWQLRGEAGKRQVDGTTLALQHNLGLGGAVMVALYALGFSNKDGNSKKSLNLNEYLTARSAESQKRRKTVSSKL